MNTTPLDLEPPQGAPLAKRDSLTRVEDILLDPDAPPRALSATRPRPDPPVRRTDPRGKAERGTGVILIYGAHLLRNGTARILGRMMERGWITHLATNGAGTIHDWEYAWLGRSTESVRANVATGTFGSWDETGRNIHLALLAGGLRGEGYGRALGRFIAEDGATIPPAQELEEAIRSEPAHRLTPARADALLAILQHGIATGRTTVTHHWKDASILAQAFRLPGADDRASGNRLRHHRQSSDLQRCRDRPGRRARFPAHRRLGRDPGRRGGPVDRLGDHGAAGLREEPQLREQPPAPGRPPDRRRPLDPCRRPPGRRRLGLVPGRATQDQPAYYLRFCKSYARMGGEMHYLQCDNAVFLHNLYHQALQA